MAALASGLKVVVNNFGGIVANDPPLKGVILGDALSALWANGASFDGTIASISPGVKAVVPPSDSGAIIAKFFGKAVKLKPVGTMELVGIFSDCYWAEDIGTTNSDLIIVIALTGPSGSPRFVAFSVAMSTLSGTAGLAAVDAYVVVVSDMSPRYK